MQVISVLRPPEKLVLEIAICLANLTGYSFASSGNFNYSIALGWGSGRNEAGF